MVQATFSILPNEVKARIVRLVDEQDTLYKARSAALPDSLRSHWRGKGIEALTLTCHELNGLAAKHVFDDEQEHISLPDSPSSVQLHPHPRPRDPEAREQSSPGEGAHPPPPPQREGDQNFQNLGYHSLRRRSPLRRQLARRRRGLGGFRGQPCPLPRRRPASLSTRSTSSTSRRLRPPSYPS